MSNRLFGLISGLKVFAIVYITVIVICYTIKVYFFLQSTLGWSDTICAAVHCHNFASGLGFL